MSNLASFGSAQASSWATQRKEAMDKAKALREGKKAPLAKTGEMTMMSHNPNDKNALNNTRGNPSKNLSNTGKYDEYENRAYPQEQRNNRTNTYNIHSKQESQKTNLGNKGKEVLSNANPNSRGNIERGVASMEQEYVKQKSLSQATQPINQTTNQNYRQAYKPNLNNDPEPQRKATTNQQYQLRTLPQGSQENYDDYPKITGNKQQPYKTRQDNTQFSTQNTAQSRVQKNQYNDKAGRNQYKNEYINPYDEPQMNQRQIGSKKDTYNQGGYGYEEKPVGSNYQASNKQQYYPEQQKEYNPMNYGTKQPSKGYSEEIYDQPKRRANYEQEQGKHYYGNNGPNQARPSSKQMPQRDAYDNSSRNSMNSYSTNFEDDRALNNKSKQQQPPSIGREKPTGSESLVECPAGCGRRFFPEVIEKHAKVCQKVFQSKRKQFDTASQRLTEDAQKVVNKKSAPPSKFNKTIANNNNTTNKKSEATGNISKQAKWKQQSEAFRASMKVARGETLSKSEQVAIANNQQDSLIPCNYCGRRFNEKAAERHIPFCQTKQKDVKKSVPKPRKF